MLYETLVKVVDEFYQEWDALPQQLKDSSFEANVCRVTLGRRAGHSTAARELLLQYRAHLLLTERTYDHYKGETTNPYVFKHITQIPKDIRWDMEVLRGVPEDVCMVIIDEAEVSWHQLRILRQKLPYLKNFCFVLLGCF